MPIDWSEYGDLMRESQAHTQHVITLIAEIMETAQVNAEAAISGVESLLRAEPAVVSRKMLPAALSFLDVMKKQPHRFVNCKRVYPADLKGAEALTKQAAEELGKAVEVFDASKFIGFLSAKAGVYFHALGRAWASSSGDADFRDGSQGSGCSVSGEN